MFFSQFRADSPLEVPLQVLTEPPANQTSTSGVGLISVPGGQVVGNWFGLVNEEYVGGVQEFLKNW